MTASINTLERRIERLRERLVPARGLPPSLWVKDDGTEEIVLQGDERWPRKRWFRYGFNPNDDGTEP